MSPSSFFRLPSCIRCIVYDALAEAEEDVRYNRTIAPSTPGHGLSTTVSKQQATIFRLNIMLVNKQFRREYCAELFRVWNAELILDDTILSPNAFLKDDFQERSILANAKSWKLGGYVGGVSGPEPQYIVSTPARAIQAYELVRSEQRTICARRGEEAAIRSAVCECEVGLTYEGASNIINAFHVNDLADDDDDGENGEGLLDEYDGDGVAWSPDETGSGLGIW
ncbi:hypothetical protein LTR59_014715 [Friedmanniomyces endolithicus]|nr:hypothetical protein LTR94_018768 [Friedmanniomyces endolithicus]KAK0774929.1 hypothetical protein LTR59_014715 [Friedmanniomyces endolithicus]KAK0779551.1 hypothetical protein LTR38_014407 [Friedmanniomyces endolithicus]